MDATRANKFIYVDVETGGLDPRSNPLLEVSYAVGNSAPTTFYPDLYQGWYEDCEAKALEVNQWLERFPDIGHPGWPTINEEGGPNRIVYGDPWHPWTSRDEDRDNWETFRLAASGRTMVGLNVNFDAEFILNNNGVFGPGKSYVTPWHHRLLNLGPWFSGLLAVGDGSGQVDNFIARGIDIDLPVSGVKIHEIVQSMVEADGGDPDNVPNGDHTAAQDVIATRFYHQYAYYFMTGGTAPAFPTED